MKANIFEIKRFAVHDGDGIRTTVFFKGCPLNCVWCHNPEGISPKTQLAYYKDKCISCGECISVCQQNAHTITEQGHILHRDNCVACGLCENACPSGALKLYGKSMTVRDVLDIVLEDRDFYDTSNGGVTLSGGECLMQADFCRELLIKLKEEGIHTAVDTCGFVSREALDKVLPYTDVFLYDIKAFSEDTHIRYTGQSNRKIWENLAYLDAQNKKIEIRIPYVPDYNAAEIDDIMQRLSRFRNIAKIKLLPYHNYAGSKYAALDMNNTLPKRLPDAAEIDAINTKYHL